MANIDLYKQKLVDIGDAIRYKLDETDKYTLEQMPTKIRSIDTGGGTHSWEDRHYNPFPSTGKSRDSSLFGEGVYFLDVPIDQVSKINFYGRAYLSSNSPNTCERSIKIGKFALAVKKNLSSGLYPFYFYDFLTDTWQHILISPSTRLIDLREVELYPQGGVNPVLFSVLDISTYTTSTNNALQEGVSDYIDVDKIYTAYLNDPDTLLRNGYSISSADAKSHPAISFNNTNTYSTNNRTYSLSNDQFYIGYVVDWYVDKDTTTSGGPNNVYGFSVDKNTVINNPYSRVSDDMNMLNSYSQITVEIKSSS